MEKKFITYQDLIQYGFKKHTAIEIIHQAKNNMVKKGYPIYLNRRLGAVPREAVESIVGACLKFNKIEKVDGSVK
ncbi:DUF3173 domain-containing protein [Pediococcus acidilactici]|uniref:DUF3173 domain-containing protein n=1 Tax=Pediococcus acidilactici TaxID=1254 RepID=UPI0019521BB9|nr:DUF3173 domain-containing protein [Pediococcus acidilactici]MBM6586262.1 DUF3173 family protein [Pediococcus acidilactici]